MTKIAGMAQRFIGNAVSSSIEELLARHLREIQEGQRTIRTDLHDMSARIDALGARLNARIDARIDELGSRLDGRIDALGIQVHGLTEDLAGLKRDGDMTRDILHRMARIEDRVFAKAV